MNIGNKIQKLRNDCNMSQAEFAEKFHVTRQTVSNWENNKNYPDWVLDCANFVSQCLDAGKKSN